MTISYLYKDEVDDAMSSPFEARSPTTSSWLKTFDLTAKDLPNKVKRNNVIW